MESRSKALAVLAVCGPIVTCLVACGDSRPLASTSATSVSHLETEAAENPLGIDVAAPRFSWQVEATRRGARQTAFELQVGSSPEGSDVWAPGKVMTDRPWADYGGVPLLSHTRYWWRVRIYDDAGTPTRWAEPQWFETAFLDPAEWKAGWIAAGNGWRAPAGCVLNQLIPVNRSCQKPAPYLRRAFHVRPNLERARLYAAAVGYGYYWINGAAISDARLDPVRSRWDVRVRYVTYDVSALLKPGANVLGADLGQGFYGQAAVDVPNLPKPEPRLSLELHLTYADGTEEVIRTGEAGWKSTEGPTTYNDPFYGETFSAARAAELANWSAPDFDDGRWVDAKPIDGPGGAMSAQMLEPIRVTERRRFSEITQPAPGIWLLKSDQNLAGVLDMRVRGAQPGTDITLGYSDKLDTTGLPLIAPEPASFLRGNRSAQWDHYIAAGSAEERWSARYTYKGFQYVQVQNWPDPAGPSLDDFTIEVLHTDLPSRSTWESSNPLLNRLWLNARWAIRQNTMGVPTDGPIMEKSGWTGDAQIMSAVTSTLFDTRRYYAKFMRDIADSQAPNGGLPTQIPSSGGATTPATAWDNALFELPRVVNLWYGDDRLMRAYYAAAKSYLAWLRDGHWIIDHLSIAPDYGDWADPNALGNCQPHTCETTGALDSVFVQPLPLHSSAFYYRWTRYMADVARALDLPGDAAGFDAEADATYARFNAIYWSELLGVYREPGLTENDIDDAMYFDILPLAYGLVPPDRQQRVAGDLRNRILRNGSHLDVGIVGGKYALPVLTEQGLHGLAYQVAVATTYPSWGYWVSRGATSLWEYWEDGARSHSHQMHGGFVQWYYESLAGIRPVAAGFAQIEFKPQPTAGLDWVRATYESVRGPVACSWRQSANRFEIEVTVPANSAGIIYVPARDISAVLESGQPVG